jgi:hypothetical protein
MCAPDTRTSPCASLSSTRWRSVRDEANFQGAIQRRAVNRRMLGAGTDNDSFAKGLSPWLT